MSRKPMLDKPTMKENEISTLAVLCTSEDVRNLTGLNVRTIQNMAKKGELPARRVGTRWLFNTRELLAQLGIDCSRLENA